MDFRLKASRINRRSDFEIIPRARILDSRSIFARPHPQSADRNEQRPAKSGQLIIYPWRNGRETRCGSRGHRANNIQVEDFTNAAQVEYRTAGSYQGAIEARYAEFTLLRSTHGCSAGMTRPGVALANTGASRIRKNYILTRSRLRVVDTEYDQRQSWFLHPQPCIRPPDSGAAASPR